MTTFGLVVAVLGFACAAGPERATPPIVAGSSTAPREVNLIARDYAFVPATVDLVPGETILLHVINGGLLLHDAVIGDAAVQDAWQVAEAATVGAPPGPTPVVSVAPDVAGLRVLVGSGQRVDVTWTVPVEPGDPADATSSRSTWFVGCHIPGHQAKGMQVRIRWILPESAAAASEPAP
jgi:uncharacterized cupredoxin-like copper-binding protein